MRNLSSNEFLSMKEGMTFFLSLPFPSFVVDGNSKDVSQESKRGTNKEDKRALIGSVRKPYEDDSRRCRCCTTYCCLVLVPEID